MDTDLVKRKEFWKAAVSEAQGQYAQLIYTALLMIFLGFWKHNDTWMLATGQITLAVSIALCMWVRLCNITDLDHCLAIMWDESRDAKLRHVEKWNITRYRITVLVYAIGLILTVIGVMAGR